MNRSDGKMRKKR